VLAMVVIALSRWTAFALPDDSPGQSDAINTNPAKETPYPFYRLTALGAITAYQRLISPSKGSACPMHPHCSQYGFDAFRRYNPVKAGAKTADRLHRCGHDLSRYETTEVDGYVRLLDPMEPLASKQGFFKRKPSYGTFYVVGLSLTPDTPRRAAAQLPAVFGTDSVLFGFAKSLQTQGFFDRAINEYQRLVFYYPDSDLVGPAVKATLDCFYDNRQYLNAAHWGLDMIEKGVCTESQDETHFVVGKSYLQLDNFKLARQHLSESTALATDDKIRAKSVMLRGAAYAYEYEWQESQRMFETAESGTHFTDNAAKCAQIAREGQDLKFKNPTLAGVLSVVPGLGYLYSGYKQTALSSFIVNSLFIWGTVEAFRRDNESLGVILGILSFGWYTGNIYGSVVTAQRRNVLMKEELVARIDVGFSY